MLKLRARTSAATAATAVRAETMRDIRVRPSRLTQFCSCADRIVLLIEQTSGVCKCTKLGILRVLDPGVPGVAGGWRGRSESIANSLHRVRDGDAVQEFHALVSQLARNAQPYRSTMVQRDLLPVHAKREEGLGMHGIGNVNAVPPVFVD